MPLRTRWGTKWKSQVWAERIKRFVEPCLHHADGQGHDLAEKLKGFGFAEDTVDPSSDTPFGLLVHPQFLADHENSRELVSKVGKQARELASAGG